MPQALIQHECVRLVYEILLSHQALNINLHSALWALRLSRWKSAAKWCATEYSTPHMFKPTVNSSTYLSMCRKHSSMDASLISCRSSVAPHGTNTLALSREAHHCGLCSTEGQAAEAPEPAQPAPNPAMSLPVDWDPLGTRSGVFRSQVLTQCSGPAGPV